MTDITREAVEALAEWLDRLALQHNGWTPYSRSRDTLLALRDALDKAERDLAEHKDAFENEYERAEKFRSERDEALEALRGVRPHLTPGVSLDNRVGEILAKHNR